MNLMEKLAEAKETLEATKTAVEAGEKTADELSEAIENVKSAQANVEAADKADELIKSLAAPVEEKAEGEKMSEFKIENLDQLKSTPGAKSVMIKANTDTITSATEYTYDHSVVDVQPALGVRDLFGQEKINTNALTYYVMGSMTGTISTVSEGAAKPQVNIAYSAVTAALAKIAAYFKETDELLSDDAFLESAIRNRGVYEFKKAVEAYLISTLSSTSGVQADTSTISFDTILAAKQDIMADTGYAADAIILNPADLTTLLQSKDGNSQYLMGGPAYGSYGNGAYSSNPKIWGLNVVESASMTAGQCLIGAFKAGAAVVTKANEGFRVEVSNSDQDDFVYNRVTVRLEERMLEAVRVPAAFYLLGTAS